MPLIERRSLSVVGRRRSLGIPLSERYSLSVVDRQRVPFLLPQERNQRRARGASPLRPQRRLRLAFGQSRRRPVTDQRTSLQHPVSRRAAGAMPLPASPRNRTGSAFGEARPLLRGAQRPRGGGKLRGFAAHARKARERPGRALFSAVRLRRAIRLRSLGAQGVCQLRPLPATDPAIGQAMHVPLPDKLAAPSIPTCWEHPQPELCPQLVYPWGVTVTCGSWQGTPGGFSRGLAEVPLSALLLPTSWARKKSARLPGRDPAISAAEGGSAQGSGPQGRVA